MRIDLDAMSFLSSTRLYVYIPPLCPSVKMKSHMVFTYSAPKNGIAADVNIAFSDGVACSTFFWFLKNSPRSLPFRSSLDSIRDGRLLFVAVAVAAAVGVGARDA